MTRMIAFPVVGPVLGLSAVLAISVMKGNWDFHDAYIGLGFFLVLAVICGLVDAALSRAAPIACRVSLVALCGVAVCAALLAVAGRSLTAMPRAMAGCAVCMAVCSLLSNRSVRAA